MCEGVKNFIVLHILEPPCKTEIIKGSKKAMERKKNVKERFACTRGRAHRAKAQNASFSSLFSSGRANQGKINDFRAPGTGAPARRTFKNAYLSMVFKGARAPAGAAAAKKGPPSATHESLVVCEHGRTRKTIVRCCVFALETRTTSHV